MNKKNLSGQIRIIGGQWRGQKLPVIDSVDLRPTTNRVRETLFNWLTPNIQHARCLDCFAGSGALGLEALSRYADFVTMIELKKSIVRQLVQNIEKLKTSDAQVIQSDTLTWLAQKGEPYKIVFIDPPFSKNLLTQTIQLLESNGWLTDGTLIYTESKVNHSTHYIPDNWFLHRRKITGQVNYCLYKRKRV